MTCAGCQTKYLKLRIVNPADNSIISTGPTDKFGGGTSGWTGYPMSSNPPGSPILVTGEDGNFYSVESVDYTRFDGLCYDNEGCSELIGCKYVVRVTLKYASSTYLNYYDTDPIGQDPSHCDDVVRRVRIWMLAGNIKILAHLVIDYACDTCPGNDTPCSPLEYLEEAGSYTGVEVPPLTQEQIDALNLPE